MLRGSNVRRYRVDPDARQGVDKFLDVARYRAEVRGQRVAHTQSARFGYQRNSALDSSRRLLVADLPVPCYCFDSVAYVPTEDALKAGAPAYAWLALLNSDLLEWVFRLTSTNNHVSTDQLHRLPAVRSTRKLGSQMEAIVDGHVAAIAAGDAAAAEALITLVRKGIAAAPPRVANVVHALDRLGRLRTSLEAQQVVAVQRFHEDLDGVLLPGKIKKLNRLWTPIRKDVDERREAARVLGDMSEQILDFSATGRLTEAQWTWVLRRKFPRLPHMADALAAYRSHAPGLMALSSQVDVVEAVINDIVFAAFRLSAEEIEVVRAGIRRT